MNVVTEKPIVRRPPVGTFYVRRKAESAQLFEDYGVETVALRSFNVVRER